MVRSPGKEVGNEEEREEEKIVREEIGKKGRQVRRFLEKSLGGLWRKEQGSKAWRYEK